MISDLNLALFTLLHLVPSDSVTTSSSGLSNPLFDEDPVNEYAEDVVLLQNIASTLRDMLSKHKELNAQDLIADYLDPKLNVTELASEGDCEDSSRPGSSQLSVSVWGNPKLFMMLVRRHLLQDVLRSAGLSERTEEHTESNLVHPIFM